MPNTGGGYYGSAFDPQANYFGQFGSGLGSFLGGLASLYPQFQQPGFQQSQNPLAAVGGLQSQFGGANPSDPTGANIGMPSMPNFGGIGATGTGASAKPFSPSPAGTGLSSSYGVPSSDPGQMNGSSLGNLLGQLYTGKPPIPGDTQSNLPAGGMTNINQGPLPSAGGGTTFNINQNANPYITQNANPSMTGGNATGGNATGGTNTNTNTATGGSANATATATAMGGAGGSGGSGGSGGGGTASSLPGSMSTGTPSLPGSMTTVPGLPGPAGPAGPAGPPGTPGLPGSLSTGNPPGLPYNPSLPPYTPGSMTGQPPSSGGGYLPGNFGTPYSPPYNPGGLPPAGLGSMGTPTPGSMTGYPPFQGGGNYPPSNFNTGGGPSSGGSYGGTGPTGGSYNIFGDPQQNGGFGPPANPLGGNNAAGNLTGPANPGNIGQFGPPANGLPGLMPPPSSGADSSGNINSGTPGSPFNPGGGAGVDQAGVSGSTTYQPPNFGLPSYQQPDPSGQTGPNGFAIQPINPNGPPVSYETVGGPGSGAPSAGGSSGYQSPNSGGGYYGSNAFTPKPPYQSPSSGGGYFGSNAFPPNNGGGNTQPTQGVGSGGLGMSNGGLGGPGFGGGPSTGFGPTAGLGMGGGPSTIPNGPYGKPFGGGSGPSFLPGGASTNPLASVFGPIPGASVDMNQPQSQPGSYIQRPNAADPTQTDTTYYSPYNSFLSPDAYNSLGSRSQGDRNMGLSGAMPPPQPPMGRPGLPNPAAVWGQSGNKGAFPGYGGQFGSLGQVGSQSVGGQSGGPSGQSGSSGSPGAGMASPGGPGGMAPPITSPPPSGMGANGVTPSSSASGPSGIGESGPSTPYSASNIANNPITSKPPPGGGSPPAPPDNQFYAPPGGLSPYGGENGGLPGVPQATSLTGANGLGPPPEGMGQAVADLTNANTTPEAKPEGNWQGGQRPSHNLGRMGQPASQNHGSWNWQQHGPGQPSRPGQQYEGAPSYNQPRPRPPGHTSFGNIVGTPPNLPFAGPWQQQQYGPPRGKATSLAGAMPPPQAGNMMYAQ